MRQSMRDPSPSGDQSRSSSASRASPSLHPERSKLRVRKMSIDAPSMVSIAATRATPTTAKPPTATGPNSMYGVSFRFADLSNAPARTPSEEPNKPATAPDGDRIRMWSHQIPDSIKGKVDPKRSVQISRPYPALLPTAASAEIHTLNAPRQQTQQTYGNPHAIAHDARGRSSSASMAGKRARQTSMTIKAKAESGIKTIGNFFVPPPPTQPASRNTSILIGSRPSSRKGSNMSAKLREFFAPDLSELHSSRRPSSSKSTQPSRESVRRGSSSSDTGRTSLRVAWRARTERKEHEFQISAPIIAAPPASYTRTTSASSSASKYLSVNNPYADEMNELVSSMQREQLEMQERDRVRAERRMQRQLDRDEAMKSLEGYEQTRRPSVQGISHERHVLRGSRETTFGDFVNHDAASVYSRESVAELDSAPTTKHAPRYQPTFVSARAMPAPLAVFPRPMEVRQPTANMQQQIKPKTNLLESSRQKASRMVSSIDKALRPSSAESEMSFADAKAPVGMMDRCVRCGRLPLGAEVLKGGLCLDCR